MPSLLAHPFAAAALAPWLPSGSRKTLLWLGAACTMVPDLDVLGHWCGVPYASAWGHRGMTHSLAFAALLAACLTGLTARCAAPALARFTFLLACTASHGLLDGMTDGGLGVAFFAPFDQGRYFLPWRAIPVSPLSVARFVQGQGLAILRAEAFYIALPALGVGALGWLAGRLIRRPQAR